MSGAAGYVVGPLWHNVIVGAEFCVSIRCFLPVYSDAISCVAAQLAVHIMSRADTSRNCKLLYRGVGGGSEADELQSRLASSNGALQSLLRRLSNGMEDLLPNSHGRARMKVANPSRFLVLPLFCSQHNGGTAKVRFTPPSPILQPAATP